MKLLKFTVTDMKTYFKLHDNPQQNLNHSLGTAVIYSDGYQFYFCIRNHYNPDYFVVFINYIHTKCNVRLFCDGAQLKLLIIFVCFSRLFYLRMHDKLSMHH